MTRRQISRESPRTLARTRVWMPRDLTTYDGFLLLDTHIWIWYLEGATESLGQTVRDRLEHAASAGRLVVCDVSFWEVAIKAAKGRLHLSVDPMVWLHRAEQAPGIRCRPLTRSLLLQSTRLGDTVHTDLADRMLIALARLEGMPLVTADRAIIDFAIADGVTPVVDARRG